MIRKNMFWCNGSTPGVESGDGVRILTHIKTSSHVIGILRILAHWIERMFWVHKVIGSTPVNTTIHIPRKFTLVHAVVV